MERINPEQAQQALGVIDDARRQVAQELGLPRALTIALALGLSADGARHSAIWAGAVVGVVLAVGGPSFLSTILHTVRR